MVHTEMNIIHRPGRDAVAIIAVHDGKNKQPGGKRFNTLGGGLIDEYTTREKQATGGKALQRRTRDRRHRPVVVY
jgi:hypothetical protein